MEEGGEKISIKAQIGYGLGAVFAMMCSTMVNTYMLEFYHIVIKLNSTNAGLIMLVGRVASGVSTLKVGFLIDWSKDCWLYKKIGQRKIWYLVGTLLIVAAVPLFFPPIGINMDECIQQDKENILDTDTENTTTIECKNRIEFAVTAYYSVFSASYGIGWTCITISHLSMLPVLASAENNKVTLNSIVYSLEMLSTICIYGSSWIFTGRGVSGDAKLGQEDADVFRNMMLLSIGLGGASSIAFCFLVSENEKNPGKIIQRRSTFQKMSFNSRVVREIEGRQLSPMDVAFLQMFGGKLRGVKGETPKMTPSLWIKETQFYLVLAIETAGAAYIYISQTYVIFYVQDTLSLPKQYLSIIPLVIYVTGIVSSCLMKVVSRKVGLKVSLFISGVLGLGGSIWAWLGCKNENTLEYEIFGLATLIGGGGSSMQLIGLTIISCFIGANIEGGGFVCSMDIITTQLVVGSVVQLIQYNVPSSTDNDNNTRAEYYRWVLAICCGITSSFFLLMAFISWKVKFGERRTINKVQPDDIGLPTIAKECCTESNQQATLQRSTETLDTNKGTR